MKDLFLIMGAALRNELRWARQHLYFLLILAPLVFGFAVITVDRAAAELPSFRPGQKTLFAGVVLVFLGLFAAGLSRAAAEVYHNRRPETVFETIPLAISAHLWLALGMRFTRAAAIVLLILAARWRWTAFEITPLVVAACLLLAIIVALTEIICGLAWIHWNHLTHWPAAVAAAFCALVSAGVAGDLVGKLFLPFEFAAHRLPLFSAIELVWSGVLLFAALCIHRRWRARDIEFALRLGHKTASGRQTGAKLFARCGRVVASLVRRDLVLVARVFSSAVYVSGAVALMTVVLLVAILWSGMLPNVENPYGWLGGMWLVPVLTVKAACVVGCLAVMALVPVLVAHQLPHLWLERSIGVRGQDLWQAKLYLTRCITLPVPIVVWLAGVLSGAAPGYYVVPLLLECVWLWWMLTTIVGSLAFEIPDRPGLALLLLNLVGFGVGMFIAWLWPVGIVAYVFGSIRGLRDRGISRAGYCLLVGES